MFKKKKQIYRQKSKTQNAKTQNSKTQNAKTQTIDIINIYIALLV